MALNSGPHLCVANLEPLFLIPFSVALCNIALKLMDRFLVGGSGYPNIGSRLETHRCGSELRAIIGVVLVLDELSESRSSCACLLHPKSRNQRKGMLEVP